MYVAFVWCYLSEWYVGSSANLESLKRRCDVKIRQEVESQPRVMAPGAHITRFAYGRPWQVLSGMKGCGDDAIAWCEDWIEVHPNAIRRD